MNRSFVNRRDYFSPQDKPSERPADPALDSALRSLSLRAHAEHELEEKLLRRGYTAQDIARVMQTLSQAGLLDDADFAGQWIQSRIRQGYGTYRITMELRQKGIPSELIDELLDEQSEDTSQLERAAELAQTRLSRGGERIKKQTFDFLVRRGYGFDIARRAIDLALKQLGCPDEDEFFD